MSIVSTSFSVAYGVRQRIETSGGSFSRAFSTAFSSAFNATVGTVGGFKLVYGVRSVVSPAKVVTVQFYIRRIVSSNGIDIRYGVRVPVSSPPAFTVQYGVRQRVQKSFSVVYNEGSIISRGAFSIAFSSAFDAIAPIVVSKGFGIVYQTLVTPRIDKVIVVPIQKDSAPPRITTTSF